LYVSGFDHELACVDAGFGGAGGCAAGPAGGVGVGVVPGVGRVQAEGACGQVGAHGAQGGVAGAFEVEGSVATGVQACTGGQVGAGSMPGPA
jgi:hypothetical protein